MKRLDERLRGRSDEEIRERSRRRRRSGGTSLTLVSRSMRAAPRSRPRRSTRCGRAAPAPDPRRGAWGRHTAPRGRHRALWCRAGAEAKLSEPVRPVACNRGHDPGCGPRLLVDGELGTISDARVLIDLPDEIGAPDGVTVAASSDLWAALFGGARRFEG